MYWAIFCDQIEKKIHSFFKPGPQYCPRDFPFAIADGNSCCKYYRRQNSGGACDGGHVDVSDEAACCLDDAVAPCDNQYGGCKDHFDAESKLSISHI